MNNYKTKMDANGNQIVTVKPASGRGFSIQTNGNLPTTNRDGVGAWTEGEVREYVRKFGTDRQRQIMDCWGYNPYQPKTGAACGCRPGQERDNCARCEGTGNVIDFAAIRARSLQA
jgi:hypothetical protein